MHVLLQAASRLGVLRLTQSSVSRESAGSTRQQVVQALRRQPKAIAATLSSGIVSRESDEQARSAAKVGHYPLIVLTAGRPVPWHDAELDRRAAAYQQVWIREMQSKLAQLSTSGRQIVVENSDHGSLMQEPGAVIAAINEVVMRVRAQSANGN
jgi:hypothetical protein